jgi:hypothetical protein
MLQIRERTPTLSPFVVFIFRFTVESIKELGGVSKKLLSNVGGFHFLVKTFKVFSLILKMKIEGDNLFENLPTNSH